MLVKIQDDIYEVKSLEIVLSRDMRQKFFLDEVVGKLRVFSAEKDKLIVKPVNSTAISIQHEVTENDHEFKTVIPW